MSFTFHTGGGGRVTSTSSSNSNGNVYNRGGGSSRGQGAFSGDSCHNGGHMGLVDQSWELLDPNPDIYGLFAAFSQDFFFGRLGSVEVKWSKRMTLCAGVCSFSPRARSCVITLSQPLLSLRPRKDLVETLLHEMIHAFLFLEGGKPDRDGHGENFKFHMRRINQMTGANITIYHNFGQEVNYYKTHWWKCDGVCQHKPPFYGMVKRSMNRAPGPNDFWYSEHKSTCGGKFIKIREPTKEDPSKQTKAKGTPVKKAIGGTGNTNTTSGPRAQGKSPSSSPSKKITDFFGKTNVQGQESSSSGTSKNSASISKPKSNQTSTSFPWSSSSSTSSGLGGGGGPRDITNSGGTSFSVNGNVAGTAGTGNRLGGSSTSKSHSVSTSTSSSYFDNLGTGHRLGGSSSGRELKIPGAFGGAHERRSYPYPQPSQQPQKSAGARASSKTKASGKVVAVVDLD